MSSFLALRMRFNGLRIKHKVFALISLIMAVCFCATYFALSYAYSTYDKQLYSKSSQVLNLSSGRIENELKKIESLSFNIATDTAFQANLAMFNEPVSDYNKNMIRWDMTERMIQYTGYEKYISSVQIIDLQNNDYFVGKIEPLSVEKRSRMFEIAAAGMGDMRWIYPDSEDKELIAVREIRSYKYFDLKPIGIMIIRIKMDEIVEAVLQGTDLVQGEFRIAADGVPVYPLESSEQAALPDDVASDHNGYVIRKLDGGQTYFLTFFRSSTYNWTYYGVIPFDEIFKRIVTMKRALLIGFAASIFLLFVISIRFAQSITRPIEDLIGRMKQAQKGNFTLNETEAIPMDEVGQLHRVFRIMIQEIDGLITENYAKQLIIKETQFKALQAQINPHFLYNTLESINWLAKINGQKQISEMVEALGHLLRSSISLKETLITVGEELQIVENYMTIQKFRFEDRLNFSIDVDERLHGCVIPKLTLQPLVENAIHYALEQMLEPCRIRIYALETADGLSLVVEDNGPGIEEGMLEKVRSGQVRTRGQGIGLTNIEERIVITFGEAYGIRLESGPATGTRVYVNIPMETSEGHV